ncbi:2OG-Fe(II) oxygenase family protein [Parvicella tangerina]|uniref:Isopenicillin N synthase-like Fe(2+) 2OG dioxygenase domain-containing protein n=1 Tax=Parvicella tangerina TaxID=2829795 RepID=A0A916JQ03_9FLAO|nr:2OG-Fe(II) oxygenase family protein [Parvicella tangerina]CAG5086213.1 hypothetical protein CRYO30217_03046 [Parvicella tangerina]
MFRNGYHKTGIKALDDDAFKKAFKNFVSKDFSYRENFLQKHFKKSIDGYSYLGQEDSLNQYDFDQLHSFVLSRFNNLDDFPDEFRPLLTEPWDKILGLVKNLERQVLEKIGDNEVVKFYERHIGHMMSANYYPAECCLGQERLSMHKDVSMFTVFPFGVDRDLEFLVNDSWESADALKEVIIFPGYLIERISKGSIKAVEHRVRQPEGVIERFSFAIFSIPIPDHRFVLDDKPSTTTEFMDEYLNLF